MPDNAFLPVGTKVQLKSGGPIMTIVNAENDINYAECCWFTGDEVRKAHFPEAALQKVD